MKKVWALTVYGIVAFAMMPWALAESPTAMPPKSHAELIADEYLVTSSGNWRLYLNEDELDFAVYDAATGEVWSNAVDISQYKEQDINEAGLSTFMLVKSMGETTESTTYIRNLVTSQSSVKMKSEKTADGIRLKFDLVKIFIEFDVVLTLKGNTLEWDIPQDSVKEKGKERLVSIQVLPMLGAGRGDQDGYLFFPDGCGSLVRFKENLSGQFPLTLPFYGADSPTAATDELQEEQGIENLGCPVFGIKADNAAMFANVVEGSAEATLTIAPGGYIYNNLYRAYVTFRFRRSYSYALDSQNERTDLDADIIPLKRTIRYTFLTGDQANYSGMAAVYRNWLQTAYGLKPLEARENVPLSVDFLMSINKKTMVFNELVRMTTYEEALEILQDLEAKGVRSMDADFIGWAKGGYDAFPTALKAESGLGGARGLNELLGYCQAQGIHTSLRMNLMQGNQEMGRYNTRRDVIREYPGILTEDLDGFHLLSGKSFHSRIVSLWRGKYDVFSNTAYSFDGIGGSLLYSYSRTNYITRAENQSAIIEAVDAISEQKPLAVAGSNIYAVAKASKISGLPDDHSNYMLADEAVPFYQMAVHGLIPYSTSAGNTSYDLTTQVLKWMETGAQPYFILTDESAEKLRNTSYTKLFSSEYRLWSDRIAEIYARYNEIMAPFQHEFMVSHVRLTEDVVKVAYSNGKSLVINYGREAYTGDGMTVPALSAAVA